MGIRIDGNNDLINAADGSLTVEGLSIDVTGIVTASGGYKVGSAYTVFSNGNVATAGIITATGADINGDLDVSGDIEVTGDLDISQDIRHTGNINTRLRFETDAIVARTSDVERLRIDSGGDINVGTAATIAANGNATFSGIVTATSFIGDGSGLSGLSGVSVANQADNRVITNTGTTDALNAEANFTFDGLNINQSMSSNGRGLIQTASGDHYIINTVNANRGSANDLIAMLEARWNSTHVADISFHAGDDTTNKDDGYISLRTSASAGGISERIRIQANGNVGIATAAPTVALDVNGHVHLGSKKFIFRNDTGHFGIYDSSTDTTPNNEIEVNAAAPQIRLEENSSGASKRLDLFVTSSGQPTIAANQSSQSIAFETTGSERFRITNDGVTFNGDTAAANALGDYEEGTYTAHFNVEGQGNMTMSGRVGKYVKVGQIVTVVGGGVVGSISGQSSSHAIQFSNLPFPEGNSGVDDNCGLPFPVKLTGMSNAGIGNMNGNEPYQFIGRLDNDSTGGRIEAIRNGSNQDPQNASLALDTNTRMFYMFTYITDA